MAFPHFPHENTRPIDYLALLVGRSGYAEFELTITARNYTDPRVVLPAWGDSQHHTATL